MNMCFRCIVCFVKNRAQVKVAFQTAYGGFDFTDTIILSRLIFRMLFMLIVENRCNVG